MPLLILIFLSIALAWAAFLKAGVAPSDWDVTLLIVGCSSLLYWLSTRRSYRAPPLKAWLRWAIYLLPGYIVFQLIPLPVGVLRLLSPARADLVKALAPVIPGIVLAPLSVNPPAAVQNLCEILAYIATFLLVRELAWRFSARPWTPVIPLLVIAAAEAALGMFQVFTRWPSGQATGTYMSYDHYAGFLELVLPFAVLYGFAILGRNKARFDSPALPAILACAVWGIATLLLLAITYSLSRMGFVVALCVLFVAAALGIGPRLPSRRWRRSALVAIGGLIAVMFVFFPPDQLVGRFADLSSTQKLSGDARVRIWQETLPVISEYPVFGCGLGGFEAVFLKYQTVLSNYRVDFAHNDYLQYLAELGFAGFALLVAIFIGVLLQIIHGVLDLREEDRRLLVVACAGAFFAVLLHSVVDFNMHIPANAMTFAWIGGISSANGLD